MTRRRHVRPRRPRGRPTGPSATAVRAQLPLLDPPSTAEEVRRDPVEPRQALSQSRGNSPPLERDGERLRGRIVGELGSARPMQVAMDRQVRSKIASKARAPSTNVPSTPRRTEPAPSACLCQRPVGGFSDSARRNSNAYRASASKTAKTTWRRDSGSKAVASSTMIRAFVEQEAADAPCRTRARQTASTTGLVSDLEQRRVCRTRSAFVRRSWPITAPWITHVAPRRLFHPGRDGVTDLDRSASRPPRARSRPRRRVDAGHSGAHPRMVVRRVGDRVHLERLLMSSTTRKAPRPAQDRVPRRCSTSSTI